MPDPSTTGPYRVSRDDGDGILRKYTVAVISEGETKVKGEPAVNESGAWRPAEYVEIVEEPQPEEPAAAQAAPKAKEAAK